mmetsp:Transcript_77958/g.180816  ORF Transcript_77958/g.180816 Transcript_77958/m.180816 type:complete len:300 (+) Transcript_77958:270-1169(+)
MALAGRDHPHLQAVRALVYPQVLCLLEAPLAEGLIRVGARNNLPPVLMEDVVRECLSSPQQAPRVVGLLHHASIWQGLESPSLQGFLESSPEHFRGEDGIHNGLREAALHASLTGGVGIRDARGLREHCLQDPGHEAAHVPAGVAVPVNQAPELEVKGQAVDPNGRSPPRSRERSVAAVVVAHRLVTVEMCLPNQVVPRDGVPHQQFGLSQFIPSCVRLLARKEKMLPVFEVHDEQGPELIRTEPLNWVRHYACQAVFDRDINMQLHAQAARAHLPHGHTLPYGPLTSALPGQEASNGK